LSFATLSPSPFRPARATRYQTYPIKRINARQLTVENLKLGLYGVGSATVTVKQAVNIDLNGIGSATIYGRPSVRNVTMNGIGKAIWK
jgi:hypothetical protein